jgi:hypothetical protein
MKNLSIILSLTMLLFVSSCKKDDTATPTKPKKDILVSKTWIVGEAIASGITVYTKGGADVANLGLAKVSLNFKSDGSITGIDNTGKALPTTAKWTLSSDETKLNLVNTGVPGLDGDLTVVQIIETNLEVKGKIIVPQISTTVPSDVNLKLVPQ